jgi:hypothetical protein
MANLQWPRPALLLRLNHGAAGVVAAVAADDMGRRGGAALGAGGELLRLDRVVRATHAGAGVRLLALGDGHGWGRGQESGARRQQIAWAGGLCRTAQDSGEIAAAEGDGRGIHHGGTEATERDIAGIRVKYGGRLAILGTNREEARRGVNWRLTIDDHLA